MAECLLGAAGGAESVAKERAIVSLRGARCEDRGVIIEGDGAVCNRGLERRQRVQLLEEGRSDVVGGGACAKDADAKEARPVRPRNVVSFQLLPQLDEKGGEGSKGAQKLGPELRTTGA